MKVKHIGSWDDEAEEISLALDDGSTLALGKAELQAITDAIYASGNPIAFDRPKQTYLAPEWFVVSGGASLIFGFRTSEGQAANFEVPTSANEQRVKAAASTIAQEIEDLGHRQQ